MSETFEIAVYNRYTGKDEIEKVYGANAVRFAYSSKLGTFLGPVIASKLVSKLYGFSQDSAHSAKKVPDFIKNFHIDMNDYEPGAFAEKKIEDSYKSFNEFFIRKFRRGKRSFIATENIMPAFSEARYFGYEAVDDSISLPVKGKMLRAQDLIGDKNIAKDFEGGPLLIARLCPVDYHRYHYPDNGKTLKSFYRRGQLHSVNPLALKLRNDIFIQNERRISILETQNFGKLAYIEVGATCVGKIVQSFDEGTQFERGSEKGYFLFGGSTVIVCGEPQKWKPCQDILDNTRQGKETYIHLGDKVATAGETLGKTLREIED